MEEDTEDVRKIDELITRHKIEVQEQEEEDEVYECGDFINYEELSEPDEIEDEYILPDFQAMDISKFQTYDPSKLLKDEEKQIVDSCKDPQLKSLLKLNRAKNIQLMQFYRKIKDLLIECQENIISKNKQIEAMKMQKRTFYRVWRLGYPYFKLKDNFPCPRNADAVEKDKNQELLFYQMTPSKKWNQMDMNRLMKGVIFCYKMGRESELKKRIVKLEGEITKKGCKDKLADLKELNAHLAELVKSDDQETPPFGSNKFVDWDKVSTSFLRQKYTDLECKNMWHLYLDPLVNKSGWGVEEQKKLVELADIYKQQNWNQIADDLGTSRSSLLACTHYFSNLTRPLKKKFTPEEDEFLYNIVQKYKQGSYIPWSKIAHHFVEKDRHQLFYRYRYNLGLKCKVSGTQRKFSEAEDVLLMVLVDKFGHKFAKCEPYFPDRSMIQLKARYTSNLKRPVKKGAFSIEEDEKIMKHVKEFGESNWTPLIKTMNRYGAQVRQRYKSLQMYFREYPGETVHNAPRRVLHNMKDTGRDDKFEFIRTIAERYKDSEIPTLQEVEQVIKEEAGEVETPVEELFGSDQETESAIDNLLTEFFVADSKKNVSDPKDESVAKMVQVLLNTFQATLEIPLNYSEDSRLDQLDKNMLDILTSKLGLRVQNQFVLPHRVAPDLGEIVPPNLENLKAMEKIIFSNLSSEDLSKTSNYTLVNAVDNLKKFAEEKDTKKVEWCMNKYLTNLDEETQSALNKEREVFFKRFVSLFKYPALVSLLKLNPRKELFKTNKKPEGPAPTKTYSKRNKNKVKSVDNKHSVIDDDDDDDDEKSRPKITATKKTILEKPVTLKETKQEIDEKPIILNEIIAQQPKNLVTEERTPIGHMVWIKSEPDTDDGFMENVPQPSTSGTSNNPQIEPAQNLADTLTKAAPVDLSKLSMVERLKLKIQNELMDLDSKNKNRKNKMKIYESDDMWRQSSASTANNTHFQIGNSRTYTNRKLEKKISEASPSPDKVSEKLPFFAKGRGRRGMIYYKRPISRRKSTENQSEIKETLVIDDLPTNNPNCEHSSSSVQQQTLVGFIAGSGNVEKQVNNPTNNNLKPKIILSLNHKDLRVVNAKVNQNESIDDGEQLAQTVVRATQPKENDLKENTRESVKNAIELLKNNPNVNLSPTTKTPEKKSFKKTGNMEDSYKIHAENELGNTQQHLRRSPRSKKSQNYDEKPEFSEDMDNLSLLDRLKHVDFEVVNTKKTRKRTKSGLKENTQKLKMPKFEVVNVPKIKQEVVEEAEFGHSTFNFQKGELVVESDSDSDLQDLKALNQVLKQVKQEVVEDDDTLFCD